MLSKCDVTLAAVLERGRREDEERRERIFNPRRRLIGIDKEALDKQVLEKKQKEAEEKQINDAYDQLRIQNDKVALLVEQSLLEERRKINKEINVFRSTFQGPETRREYEIPARESFGDPIFGVSSGQKFSGEDLACQNRDKAQKEQNKAWLEQQILERKKEEWENKHTQKAYDDLMLAMDKRACEVENLERKCRRQLNESLKQYNRFLAEEKLQDQYSEKQKEEEDKKAEICNSMLGDLLCENRNVHQSNLGPNRVRGSMYKGMSEEEIKAFHLEQHYQVEEKIKQREEESRIEAEWNKLAEGIAHNVFLKDMENAQKKRQLQTELFQQNRVLCEEQKERRQFLDKYVYTSSISDDFYKQFNKTPR